MPRRRMLDPDFWKDHCIANLSRDERLFLIGCINNGDDEGRLEGHSAYLKAAIFMYDDDLTILKVAELRDSCLEKMKTWPVNHQHRILSYQNSGETYLFFPNWQDQQKPSHPTKSKLPPPSPETLPIFSTASPEPLPTTSRDTPSQSSIGQSSQGKYSIGQVSEVQEDFTKFKNENELTDFLTTTLTKYISAGRERAGPGESDEKDRSGAAGWGVTVLKKFWKQATGSELTGVLWQGAYFALQKYPVEVVARAFVKAGPYGGGKHRSWKYIETIIDEEMEKRGIDRNRSP